MLCVFVYLCYIATTANLLCATQNVILFERAAKLIFNNSNALACQPVESSSTPQIKQPRIAFSNAIEMPKMKMWPFRPNACCTIDLAIKFESENAHLIPTLLCTMW